jgi:hypothetical protein
MKNCNHSIYWLAIVALGFTTSLAYSGESSPTEADGKKALEAQVVVRGCIKVNNFKKINATAGEVMGVKFYEMEYEASYSVLSQPCYGKYDIKRKSFDEVPSNKPNAVKQFSKEAQNLLPPAQDFPVTKRKLTFIKKENGWEAKQGMHF